MEFILSLSLAQRKRPVLDIVSYCMPTDIDYLFQLK